MHSAYWLIPAAIVIVSVIQLAIYVYNRYTSQSSTSLTTAEYRPFRLINKTPITHNTFLFRFALPSPTAKLGLPIGKHIVLRFEDKSVPAPADTTNGTDTTAAAQPVVTSNSTPKYVSRQYTPITNDATTRGYFELLIKVYPLGKMGQYLAKMDIGQSIDVRGPMGMLQYLGKGMVTVNRGSGWQTFAVTSIGFLAGGTGITPCLQIINSILNDPTDLTELSLIFANVTIDDILLYDEINALKEKYSKLNIYYTLNTPPTTWSYGSGFINKTMIEKFMPPPVQPGALVCMCGPKPMTDSMERLLTEVGYATTQWYRF